MNTPGAGQYQLDELFMLTRSRERSPQPGGFSMQFPLLVDVGLLDVTSFWRVVGDDNFISRRAARDDEGDVNHGVLVADVAQ